MTEKEVKSKFNTTKSVSTFFRLEAVRHRSGMSLLFSGIVGIDVFCDNEIVLKSHGCRISINGKRLNLTVFENNSLEITGRIEGVDFKYGKN